jgi:hypothetical protein
MKIQKIKLVVLMLVFVLGMFSCSKDDTEENMVSIKIQCGFTDAVDPNILSFALPGIVLAHIIEYLPYPNYGGIPEAWSPHEWSIHLIMAKGTDRTKLAPVITLAPGATIKPESGTVRDFTKQVEWTLIAPDGSTVGYQVDVFVIGDPVSILEEDEDGNQIPIIIYPDDPRYPYQN